MKNIKYIHNLGNKISVVLLLILISVTGLSAQSIAVNLNVNSRPTAYLAEWYRPQNGIVAVMVRKGEQQSLNIRFETELLDSEGELIYTLPFLQSELLQITGSVTTFPLSSVLQLQNGNFISSKLTRRFIGGGKLSPGQYTLRVRVWHDMEDMPMTEWSPSKVFNINHYQLPQLLQPADGNELDLRQANSVITFRWTPLMPSMAQSVPTYRIQIWQVMPGHTPVQSMLSTPPIEDRYIKGTTQFIWQPRLGMIEDDPSGTNQFIWTVQTLDEMDLPVETKDPADLLSLPVETADPFAQGRSEPAVFTVAAKKPGTPPVTDVDEDDLSESVN